MKAALHLQTRLRQQHTVLQKTFCTAPFKIADITQAAGAAYRRVMLMNASPGVLDGDDYELLIEVAAGTSLYLETQSYQRIFNMQGSARQTMGVRVGEGAYFSFLPHPSVPHKDACFVAHNCFHLEQDSCLVWGEVLTSGRIGNGESFQFRKFQSLTEIWISGKLVYKDNLLLLPSTIAPLQLGLMETYTHQASLLFIAGSDYDKNITDTVLEILSTEKGIDAGITQLSVPGFLLRVLGHKAEQLHACLKRIAQALPAPTQTRPAYVL